ncbi:heat shock transcription factor, X-linked-like [Pontoporia blainvillei]|uniref:Heat shock transcription factor, X-linked-like n=1 Tax=Pontoporia blainvillei TaxID=48723 RepID=A0ABX0S3X1_PONBL|nr:heat shock transcription factor, X-linked-like [Pontoporia blainvillei]
MASQSSDELCTAMLGPSADAEPATWVPSRESRHPTVDSRESSEKQGDQAKSPDPGSQDNPPPQGANYGVANQSILQLSLPRKLWRLVEDPAFTSVRWNDKGDTVIIEEDLFQREVLHRRGADRIFNTDSLQTFIRQMNRYGFSKICLTSHSPGKKRLMIFCNSNFQRDKPLLIENFQRKRNLGATDQPGTSARAPKGKRPVAATRRSPQIHYNDSTTQKKAPKKPKSTGVNKESNEKCESCVLSNCPYYSHISVDGPDEAGNPHPRQALVPPPANVPFRLEQQHFPRSATDVARER